MNDNHEEARPFEDLISIQFSQKQIAEQETTDVEECSQKYRGIVYGSPEDIQI
jgi:hypothetical protein